MQISVSSTLTVYHDGQFWVGLAERVEGGRYGVARIVFGAEPSDEEILRFVASKWDKLSFFGHDSTEASKPAKNPKRRAREASKALKRPAVSTKAQQALAAQREAMKRESAQARSQRRADEAEALHYPARPHHDRDFVEGESLRRVPIDSREFDRTLESSYDEFDEEQ